MKKLLCLLLAVLFLVLCACAERNAAPEPVQPFTFYYRTAELSYDSPYGPLGVEIRDLGANGMTDEALVALYLQGPQSEGLISPFPPDVRLLQISAGATLLRVQLSEEYAALQGVDASIADACLAKTLQGLGSFRRIRISAMDEDGQELRSVTLDGDEILLADQQSDADRLDLTLYFADAEGRYLLAEKRSVSNLPESGLAQYVTEQLLLGPQTTGLNAVAPVGTVLLDINVEGGVCAVDLSAEFLANREALGLPEHLTLLALTNTLTELDGIDQVQFYVEGRQDRPYGDFPLSQGFTAETRVVGPRHPELNELDCTLSLPLSGSDQLYHLPLRTRSGSSETPVQTLVNALFSYAPQNGLDNPWYDQPLPQSVTLEEGVCTVDFAANPLADSSDTIRSLALRSLYDTVFKFEDVTEVRITVNGEPA